MSGHLESRSIERTLLLALCALLTCGLPMIQARPASSGGTAPQVNSEDSEEWTKFTGDETSVGIEHPGSHGVPASGPEPSDVEVQTRSWRFIDCRNSDLARGYPDLLNACRANGEFTCEDGSDPRPAVIYRTRPVGTKEWSVWRLAEPLCPSPEDDLATELAREIRTLKIPPRHARIAPVTTWFTVQIPMTYFTDAGAERLEVTVLGTDVELELTPSSYSWDPGDGSAPIVTTKTGAPYPDQTVTHTYTKVGTYRVTLTTTWRGRFRVAGATTWRDIEGTGSTTHTSSPFETREVRSVLTG